MTLILCWCVGPRICRISSLVCKRETGRGRRVLLSAAGITHFGVHPGTFAMIFWAKMHSLAGVEEAHGRIRVGMMITMFRVPFVCCVGYGIPQAMCHSQTVQ